MCSLLVGRGRGEVFDERFHSQGQPGSPECQPQVNKCVIDVGTAPVSPREALFFSFLQMGIVVALMAEGGGRVAALCPLFTPLSHHRGQHQVKKERG